MFHFWDQKFLFKVISFNQYIHDQYVRCVLSCKFHKNQVHCNFETKSAQVFDFGSRPTLSNMEFMINKLDLLNVPYFIALGIYFIFSTKFFWDEVVILVSMSNVCYLAVVLVFLVISWWLLFVTNCQCSFPLLF